MVHRVLQFREKLGAERLGLRRLTGERLQVREAPWEGSFESCVSPGAPRGPSQRDSGPRFSRATHLAR